MKYSIYDKTVLIPYIIAEMAAWEVLEEHHKDLTPTQCGIIVESVSPLLCIRADFHFSQDGISGRQFRKNVASPDPEKGRNYLYSFMYHWTQGLLHNKALIKFAKQKATNYEQLQQKRAT